MFNLAIMNTITRSLIILFIGFFISISTSFAQTDSTKNVVYDVVSLTKGGLKQGKILSHDESTGILVFKDKYGRVYTLNSNEYEYFKEDQIFIDRDKRRADKKKAKADKKKAKGIHPRKETEFEISVGFSQNAIFTRNKFIADELYIEGRGIRNEVPSALRVSAGKYLNRRNFFGLNSELGFLGEINYLSVGARYSYQYDAHKGNVAMYIPIEFNYQRTGFATRYTTFDYYSGGYTYYSSAEIPTTLNSYSIGLGHGLAFILPNKRSIGLEFLVQKSFFMNSKLVPEEGVEPPNVTFRTSTIRLSLIFNI